jgi:outer membrane protein assembly factor BamB
VRFMSSLPRWQRLVLAAAFCAAGRSAHAQWTQLGGSPGRVATAMSIAPSLTNPAWTCSTDENNNFISFLPQSGLVASLECVFALGIVTPAGSDGEVRLFAISRVTGLVGWSAYVDSSESWSVQYGSVSGPAIDQLRGTVIVTSGYVVRAFRLSDGGEVWQCPLNNYVINASPLITNDRPGQDRAFITDYGLAKLYCINVSPFDAQTNPFQPGQLVWRTSIGFASGATPTYFPTPDGGRVVVGNFRPGTPTPPGQIMCFPAGATTPPAPLWVTNNTIGAGFFGGLSIRPGTGGAGAVYAGSYNFSGNELSANLIKLDAMTGAVIWSAPANRTDSIPVPLADGSIVLSGGIDGFGSFMNLATFRDHGDHATMEWATSPEQSIGGRLIQPTVVTSPVGRRVLCSAAASEDDMGYSTELFLIDPSHPPGTPGFLVDYFQGAGGSPIIANGNIYTVGFDGLVAFGPPPARTDVNQDGRATIDDLYAWESGTGARDVDQSGAVDAADRTRLISELRAFKAPDMIGSRP